MRFPMIPIGAPPAMSRAERDAVWREREAVIAQTRQILARAKPKRTTSTKRQSRPLSATYEMQIAVGRKSLKLAAAAEKRQRKAAAEKKAAADAQHEKYQRQLSLLRFVSQQGLRQKRRAEGRAMLKKRGLIA